MSTCQSVPFKRQKSYFKHREFFAGLPVTLLAPGPSPARSRKWSRR
jgi:hypothetical protein